MKKCCKTSAYMYRFLIRAAMKTESDVKPDVTIRNPCRLCSIEQAEDFKAVIQVLPLWLAIMFLSAPQALVMNCHFGMHFKIPAGSLQVITLISSCIFLILNNWSLPLVYQKVTPNSLTLLQRVGVGHVLNILSMVSPVIVESKSPKTIQHDHLMSVLWLFPPLVIVGICEAFRFPGNVALCHQEFPESERSTATSMTSVVIEISFYLSTALIDLIQKTTAWLPDDINHGRVDNVYWVFGHRRSSESWVFSGLLLVLQIQNQDDDDGQDSVSGSFSLF